MIVVLGGMRSGSSALARALHHLGVPMGVSMAMPIPCIPQEDYEDALLAVLALDTPRPSVLAAYIRERRAHYERAWNQYENVRGFGVKVLALALCWPAWCEAAASVGEPLRVILARRVSADADASLVRCAHALVPERRNAWLQGMRAIQEQLLKALAPIRADLIVEHDEHQAQPYETRERLRAWVEEGA